jgi:hypothetical protein
MPREGGPVRESVAFAAFAALATLAVTLLAPAIGHGGALAGWTQSF